MRRQILALVLLSVCAPALAEPQLPPPEAKIKDTVDHWGLAFSDQFRLFQTAFDQYRRQTRNPAADYALGVESPLRKTFPNKYWFKGKLTTEIQLAAGRNESEAFQLAVIPKTGFALKDVTVSVSDFRNAAGRPVIPARAVQLWRVGFVQTARPPYPVRHVGLWPDPLLALGKFSIDGVDLGLVWYEVKVPADTPPGDYTATLTVSPANAKPTTLKIRLHVWNFTLPRRISFPTMVWIQGDMKSDAYRNLCALFLEHHLDPISVGQTTDLALLDRNLAFCLARGQMFFQTPAFDKPESLRPYYDHLVKKGWLDKAIIYSPADEPTQEQLRQIIIPRTQLLRKDFPGLKTFLATEYHDHLDRATDIWLTDLSTGFESWLAAGRPGRQQLWLYFCHLPIRCHLSQPLVDAPNMLIDNDAIEHRLAYWMAWRYQAQGIFIWAGNMTWPNDLAPLSARNMGFPYGGVHNGNGYLVYPGPIPSIRLKIIRDAVEDYWYLTQAKALARTGPRAAAAQQLLDRVTPEIFVDPHYFTRDPDRLLHFRQQLGDLIDAAQGR